MIGLLFVCGKRGKKSFRAGPKHSGGPVFPKSKKPQRFARIAIDKIGATLYNGDSLQRRYSS